MAAMGAGAVLGGLSRPTGADRRPGCSPPSALVFGAPSWRSRSLRRALAPGRSSCSWGRRSISFVATNNATLQLRTDPAMRGRVMSLNAIAFLGSTPIGAPLMGAISDAASPRVALWRWGRWPPWPSRSRWPGAGATSLSRRRPAPPAVVLEHTARTTPPADGSATGRPGGFGSPGAHVTSGIGPSAGVGPGARRRRRPSADPGRTGRRWGPNDGPRDRRRRRLRLLGQRRAPARRRCCAGSRPSRPRSSPSGRRRTSDCRSSTG